MHTGGLVIMGDTWFRVHNNFVQYCYMATTTDLIQILKWDAFEQEITNFVGHCIDTKVQGQNLGFGQNDIIVMRGGVRCSRLGCKAGQTDPFTAPSI